MQELWDRVSRVLETSNKEHTKWQRYCREQGDLLRALEDLAAQEPRPAIGRGSGRRRY
jgi:hypothetical protein